MYSTEGHRICCFLANRLLTSWLIVDSTNAVLILSLCRHRLAKFWNEVAVVLDVDLELGQTVGNFRRRD
jgi:hypothetical protein